MERAKDMSGLGVALTVPATCTVEYSVDVLSQSSVPHVTVFAIFIFILMIRGISGIALTFAMIGEKREKMQQVMSGDYAPMKLLLRESHKPSLVQMLISTRFRSFPG